MRLPGRTEQRTARQRLAPVAGAAVALALALVLWAAPSCAAMPPAASGVAPTSGPATAPGAAVSSVMLIEDATAWDRRIIAFTGEAVGEVMMRGIHGWLQLNDDAFQIQNPEQRNLPGRYNSGQAVWVPAALARRVRTFGDFRHQGDVVRVLGEFHAACREHGGDMDLHATDLEIVRAGHAVARPPNLRRLGLAVGLLALAAALSLASRREGRR